jgi:hypothetical protein
MGILIMATSRRRAAGRKNARAFNAAARPRKVIMKGYEFVPTAVLRQLSELALPADKDEYNKRLSELLRGAG